MRISNLLATLLSATFVGCTPHYVQPTGGATAEVRVRYIGNEAFALVHTFEKASCEGPQAIGVIGSKAMLPTPEKDPSRGSRPGMLGSSGRPEAEVLEVAVPAGRPLTLLYTQLGPHDLMVARTCSLPVTFTPETGGQYEVQFRSGRQVCSSEVLRLHPGEASAYRSTPIPVIKESKDCKPTRI
jgi:hypothetical protein